MARQQMLINELIDFQDTQNEWREFQLTDYPDFAEYGNFRIERFQTDRQRRKQTILREGLERDPGNGIFRKLVEYFPGEVDENGTDKHVLWMSDTRAEIEEHYPFFNVLRSARHVKGKRIIINGLGLGMVAHGATLFEDTATIDVVEANEDVAKLVFPLLPKNVQVHIGDAYEMQWPKNYRWDYAWHDIWPTISDDNLPGMAQLKAKYKSRVHWQGCWRYDGCMAFHRAFALADRNALPYEHAEMMARGIAPWRLGY